LAQKKKPNILINNKESTNEYPTTTKETKETNNDIDCYNNGNCCCNHNCCDCKIRKKEAKIMPELDLALVCLALATAIYTQHRETSLLFFMFLGSSSAIYFDFHLFLERLWYPVLSLYLIVFCTLSRSLGIAIVYFCMQALCLLSVWEYPTEHSSIYENFALIMSVLYLIQLGVSVYGHYDNIQRGCNNGEYGSFTTGYTRVMV